jgi:hypothetical protein
MGCIARQRLLVQLASVAYACYVAVAVVLLECLRLAVACWQNPCFQKASSAVWHVQPGSTAPPCCSAAVAADMSCTYRLCFDVRFLVIS